MEAERAPNREPPEVTPEATNVDSFLDGVAQDVRDEGIEFSTKEEKGWRGFMKGFFHKAKLENAQAPIPEKTKGAFREFIDWLPDYFGAVKEVSDRYGFTTSAGPKLRFWQGALGAVAAVDGIGPQYVAWNLLNKEVARESQALSKVRTFGPQSLSSADRKRVLRRQVESKQRLDDFTMTPEEQSAHAGSVLRQFLPLTFSLVGIPLSRLSGRVREQFGKEMVSVERSLNKRIANSVLMRDYEFLQDASAGDLVKTMERGRWAVVTLMSSTYLEVWPRLISSVAALGSQALTHPLVGALTLLRTPFYIRAAKDHIEEGRKWTGEEVGKQKKIERMVGSMFRSIELVKTDDVEHAANELAGALDSRDDVLRGRDRELSDQEKRHLKTTRFFDWGIPSVSALTQLAKRFTSSMNTIAHPVPADIPLEAKLRAKADRAAFNVQSNMKEQSKLVIEGSQLLNTVLTADRTQSVIKNHVNALVGLYTGTLRTAVDESRKFEEFLSKADEGDMPGGEKEQARMSVGDLHNFDIKVNNLSFENILQNISLEIPQGTFVTIKGPKGAGKTTLMRSLLGLYGRESGAVSYGGVSIKDIKKYGDQGLNARIGYANQNPQYFDGMSLRENLLLWSQRVASDERIRSVLTDLGMEKFAGDIGTNKRFHFSGGELRMIGLARALLKDPSVLFLDEPTSNLDPDSARQVMEVVQSLRAKRPEMTVIAITHDASFEQIAERVVDFGELNKQAGDLRENQVYEAVAKPQ